MPRPSISYKYMDQFIVASSSATVSLPRPSIPVTAAYDSVKMVSARGAIYTLSSSSRLDTYQQELGQTWLVGRSAERWDCRMGSNISKLITSLTRYLESPRRAVSQGADELRGCNRFQIWIVFLFPYWRTSLSVNSCELDCVTKPGMVLSSTRYRRLYH